MLDGMRVVHVGAYPPPYGGVALHVKRLDALCRWEGISSVVIDGYGNPDEPVRDGAEVVRLRGSRVRKLAQLIWKLRSEKAEVVHFHLSSLSRFLWGAAPVMVATRGRVRVASLHSGSFVRSYEAEIAPIKPYARAVFQRFDHLLTANTAQRDFLVGRMGLSHDRVSTVPAFLPPRVGAGPGLASLPASIGEFRGRFERLAVVTGFMKPYYGLHTVIEAFDSLTDLPIGLIVHSYTSVDENYRRRVQAMVRERSNVYWSEVELDEEQMTALLTAADVFVRATSVDGDSVALREAAYLGRQIVATAVVPRPEGCLLFPFEDSWTLANCIREALADSNAGRVLNVDSQGGDQILALYKRLTGV